MKNVVVFGASGKTGQCVLSSALKEGYTVRAFVRKAASLPDEVSAKVEIFEGDVTEEADVKRAVAGQDAVIVALGTRDNLSPTTVLSDGLKNILAAMSDAKVTRMSACLSAFLFLEESKVPERFRPITKDHRKMHETLKQCDLQWVAVFPPHISDGPPTGKYTVKHDEGPGRVVSKHDLGEFLVKCLNMPEHTRKVCGIASP